MKKFLFCILAASAVAAAHCAAIGTYSRLVTLEESPGNTGLECVVHGIVTHTSAIRPGYFVLAKRDMPHRGGVFVHVAEGVNMPSEGDELDVSGKTFFIYGRPGITDATYARTGAIRLGAGKRLRNVDLRNDRLDYRRVVLEGKVDGVRAEAESGQNPCTTLRVLEGNKIILAKIPGALDKRDYAGRHVRIAGCVLPVQDPMGLKSIKCVEASDISDIEFLDSQSVSRERMYFVLAIGAGAVLAAMLVVLAVFWFRIRRERIAAAAIAGDRRRIADDLHDNMQQLLAGIGFRLDAALNRTDAPDVAVEIASAKKTLGNAQAGLRSVLWGLQESTGKGADSVAGLFRYAASRMPHWEGVVTIESAGEEQAWVRAKGSRLLMVMQEAVGNALNHGDATRVAVRLVAEGNAFRMTVEDNGCGFDAANVKGGIGLASMKRRAKEIGGKLSVKSETGKGTAIELEIRN